MLTRIKNLNLARTVQSIVFFGLFALTLTLQAQTPKFKVLAFYNGTFDAAHINFVKEARVWYPQLATANGFSWESTNDWSRLNATNLAQYQVVMFLDDMPPTAQRGAFQTYMQNGGAWMGHHVCAFNTNPADWDWYHNQFLGTGAFKTNTWGPTTAVLKCEDQTHPSTLRLPTTFTSAVSEWYGWNNDLRNNPNIKILCSIDPSSFPLGTDPNQSWYSGYYPIMWTNKNYKMIYANFGHNDMDYATNTGKSSTFASEIQNRFILDALLWLGGASNNTTAYPIPGTVQAENYAAMSGIQLEATTDAGGGQNVGWIDANDWMDYKVNVQTAGTYTVSYRVASLNGGGSIQLKSGSTVLATTAVSATGGWQNWSTVTATATLAAGTQTLRLQAAAGGFNINWVSMTTNTSTFSTTIQAESYSSMSGVQLETTTDTGGGQNVGYIDANDWMAYPAVNIPSSGTYTIQYRVASANGGGNIQLERAGGSAVFGSIAVPSTGGWQTWTTISQNVTLPAGSLSFGIKANAGGFNLNWFSVKTPGAREAIAEEGTEHTISLNFEKGITLSPNPAKQDAHTLTISFEKEPGDVKVHLHDINGVTILTHEYKDVKKQIEVLLPSMARGMYIVKIQGQQKSSIKKYLVE
jgi:hypothetical protein